MHFLQKHAHIIFGLLHFVALKKDYTFMLQRRLRNRTELFPSKSLRDAFLKGNFLVHTRSSWKRDISVELHSNSNPERRQEFRRDLGKQIVE